MDTQASGNYRKITAFLGGIDLCDGRYDTPEHRLFRDLNTVFENDYHNPTFPVSFWSNGFVIEYCNMPSIYHLNVFDVFLGVSMILVFNSKGFLCDCIIFNNGFRARDDIYSCYYQF